MLKVRFCLTQDGERSSVVEQRFVVPLAVGSIPIARPIFYDSKGASMKTHVLSIDTTEPFEMINLTQEVADFLESIGAQEGLVNVFTQHTTTALKINEDEEGFHQDLKKLMCESLAPANEAYHHNDLENRDPATLCPLGGEECLNGHSHLQQMLLGSASETIPVKEGSMVLGTWQQIFLIELDHGRSRNVFVSFVGTCD